MNRNQISKFVLQAFEEVCAGGPFGQFIRSLKHSGVDFVVFGGWVRDRVIEAKDGQVIDSSDIDLVYYDSNVDRDEVASLLPPPVETATLGGMRAKIGQVKVEIWPLEETYAIRCGYLECHIRNLPKSTLLDVNSVLLFPLGSESPGLLAEQVFWRALDAKSIDFSTLGLFVRSGFEFREVARIASIAYRLRFGMSERVLNFIQENYSSGTRDSAERYLGRKHDKQVVESILQVLSSWVNGDSDAPVLKTGNRDC